MEIKLKKLDINDGMDIYEMLQEIPGSENGFENSASNISYDEFKEWLKKKDKSSKQEGVIDGWKVPQSTYWLFVDEKPVGVGRIQHFLTEKLLEVGGSVGMGIRPSERGKRYGKVFLELLLKEASELGIENALLTIRKDNLPSYRTAISVIGVKLEKETTERYYLWADTNVFAKSLEEEKSL